MVILSKKCTINIQVYIGNFLHALKLNKVYCNNMVFHEICP